MTSTESMNTGSSIHERARSKFTGAKENLNSSPRSSATNKSSRHCCPALIAMSAACLSDLNSRSLRGLSLLRGRSPSRRFGWADTGSFFLNLNHQRLKLRRIHQQAGAFGGGSYFGNQHPTNSSRDEQWR